MPSPIGTKTGPYDISALLGLQVMDGFLQGFCWWTGSVQIIDGIDGPYFTEILGQTTCQLYVVQALLYDLMAAPIFTAKAVASSVLS